ncbi:MAG: histidine phosphatase family protein [Bacteroidetes bacterium]|nr:histidine phosphatase family protein [Bacteroidota bacterium]MCW5896664.1 histidine phosphatase family protein [Bacteroidota bacterium]
MMKTPAMQRTTVAVLACLMFGGCCSSTVTTIVLVRHAERLNNTDTTPLSPAGFQRAGALRHALDSAGIRTIFVTDKLRTQQTAESLRVAHSLPEVQLPASETQRLVDSLRSRSGQKLLVVGHSDTVPQIIEAFGFSPPPAIGGTEFDKMFILTLRKNANRLLQLQYGAKSP